MKRTDTKLVCLTLAVLMMLSLLSGCGAGSGKGSDSAVTDAFVRKTAEGTLTIGTTFSPGTFEAGSYNLNRSIYLIYDTLVRMDAYTMEILPSLAESWEYSEDSLSITFHLRKGVKFTNGEELTANDAFFTLHRSATTPGLANSNFAEIDWDNSKVVDDYTLVLSYFDVYPRALADLASGMSCIMCESVVSGSTEDDFWANPVGTGAYTVVENVSGSHTTFQRKAAGDYWRELPASETVTVKFYAEPSTMFIDYENGDIDAATCIDASDVARLQTGEISHTNFEVLPTYDVAYLALPSYVECFEDIRVRQAFASAIDFAALTQATYGVLGSLADSTVPSASMYYKSVGTYEYNPEKAKELLKEAGYETGLSLRFIIPNSTTNTVVAEAVQAYLEAVGVTLTIEPYDFPTAIGMIAGGESQLCVGSSGGGLSCYDPGKIYETVASTSTNISCMRPEVDLNELISTAAHTNDAAVREDCYARIQQMMFDNVYQLPICNVNSCIVYRDYISAFPVYNAADFDAGLVTFVG